MNEEQKQKIRNRIKRLQGQVGALDRLLDGNVENFIIQTEAVISAGRGLLGQYVDSALLSNSKLDDNIQKNLKRLIKKI